MLFYLDACVKKKLLHRLWNYCKHTDEAQNVLVCCFFHLQVCSFLSCCCENFSYLHQFPIHQVFTSARKLVFGRLAVFCCLSRLSFFKIPPPLINLLALYFSGCDLGLKSQSLNFTGGDEQYKQESLQYLN